MRSRPSIMSPCKILEEQTDQACMLRIIGNGHPPPIQAIQILSTNQSVSFKGRAAQQTEQREAMTKPGVSGQIELARIWLLSPGFIGP